MNDPLIELKVRARLLRKAQRGAEPELRLRDCLHRVAREVGFVHWEHARQVLGGHAEPATDRGTFWHAPRCNHLLNPWFASLVEARAAQESHGAEGAAARTVLLPYRRHFVLAGGDYLRELGLDPLDPALAEVRHDLVQAYGSSAWRSLVMKRLNAPRTTFTAPRNAPAP